MVFLSADPLENEADMKGRKEKIYSQGTTLDVSQIVRPSFGLVLNFNLPIMSDGILRIVNELHAQSTFQMALIAYRPSCPLGF